MSANRRQAGVRVRGAMRSAPLLLLAACSAATRAPVMPVAESDSPPVQVAAAPAAPAPQRVTVEAADDAASVKPVRTYQIPATTVSALAREKIRGQILVAGPAFPTDAAARAL